AIMWAALNKTEKACAPLIEQGKAVLVSYFDHSGRVKLLFVSNEGWKAYWVTRDEYKFRPRGKAVLTLDDFPNAKAAKTTDIYDGEYDIEAVAHRVETVHARTERR